MCKAVLSVRGTTSIWKFGNECGILEQLHQLMQILLLFCTKKLFFLFYAPIFIKHPISLSIPHVYSIKYSFFTIFYYFLSLIASLSQTQSETHLPHRLSLSHRPNPPLAHFLINQTIITILHFIIK